MKLKTFALDQRRLSLPKRKNVSFQQDTRTSPDLPELNLHVLPVFDLGYKGKGVRVCVLDDGLEHEHGDIKDNYVRLQSRKIKARLEN